jgi:hypothetical protein
VPLQGQLRIPVETLTGTLSWTEKVLGEVELKITTRSDYCMIIGSRGMASVLEKANCNHVKAIGETSFDMSIDY